jgi:hypothetical protein
MFDKEKSIKPASDLDVFIDYGEMLRRRSEAYMLIAFLPNQCVVGVHRRQSCYDNE